MLISPPFLVARRDGESDVEWVDRCMVGGRIGEGGFPVSFNLGWHGGMHLTAPAAANGSEPVRAIADGTVSFVRQPTPQPAGPLPDAHPQAYRGGWTDNGVVVLRHEEEIGTGADAQPVFYSFYIHLSAIAPAIQQGRSVYRKTEMGTAGQIYGSLERQLHLEIVTDDVNTRRLAGRMAGDLALSADGRTDAVYGELGFVLPMGTQIFGQQPKSNSSRAVTGADDATIDLEPTHTTSQVLIIGVRNDCGQARANQRGDSTVATYLAAGSELGVALREVAAEYKMYDSAQSISTSYPAVNRPSPNAVYELLRLGRTVSGDTLAPADVPHWRLINYPGGTGWTNLNAPGVRKFSDADFPHWKHWSLVDDSADNDSRCDSAAIKAMVQAGSSAREAETPGQSLVPTAPGSALSDAVAAAQSLQTTAATATGIGEQCQTVETLVDAALRRTAIPLDPQAELKLSRAICKFPTEWDATTSAARWQWLKSASPSNPQPLSNPDFDELQAHIAALAFWPGGTTLPNAHWHWQPREFIRHVRQCAWLTERQMLRCIPRLYRTNQTNRNSPVVQATVTTATARTRLAARDRTQMMLAFRKYGLTGQRLAHFLAQVYQETGVLRWSQELASGAEYEGRVDLGNTQLGDGMRFRGRGLIQTTGRTNYEKYGHYHGRQGQSRFTIEPNNLLLATDPHFAVDAAGVYWVSRAVILHPPTTGISRLADVGIEDANTRRVTRNVNGAEDALWTGLVARLSHLKVTASVLLDDVAPLGIEQVRDDV